MAEARIGDIDSALNRKGFIKADDRNRHIFYYFCHNGKKTAINTHYSKGAKSISEPLIHDMARQMKLTKDQFLQYVECSISLTDYVTILREKGFI